MNYMLLPTSRSQAWMLSGSCVPAIGKSVG
jgi:hypothetical protein